jgi:hypothetical protein
VQCEKGPFTKIDEGQNRLNHRSGEVTFSACRVESEGGRLSDSLQEHHFRRASDGEFRGNQEVPDWVCAGLDIRGLVCVGVFTSLCALTELAVSVA